MAAAHPIIKGQGRRRVPLKPTVGRIRRQKGNAMDFEKLFSEYWRKVVAEGDNSLDKKAIARNAFAAGLAIRPTTHAPDAPLCSACGLEPAYENGLCWDCLPG